jgi:hypothetical protein
MAITATVDLGNGVSKASCYIIVPTAYVKKFDELDKDGNPIGFQLIYDVEIYQNKSARDSSRQPSNQIKCRKVDHHKIDYDPTTSDNPFKLAYTHLKTNSSLSSVSDA